MRMNEKKYKLQIAMLVAGMPFQGDTLEHKSLGGSETAGLCLAREFGRQGHDIVVFSNCEKPGKYGQVLYAPVSEFANFVSNTPTDVVIAQRLPTTFAQKMLSKVNVLWQHDLALKRTSSEFNAVLWNVDRVATVSQFMTDQYKTVYGGEHVDDLYFTSSNGIDLDLFKGLTSLPRNKKQLVYGARPERGLDNMLNNILPKVLERDPEITLKVCGYDNPTDQMNEFYGAMHARMAEFGDRVEWVGCLTKMELYKLYASSGLYVYPTPSQVSSNFAEVSCITAMECQAAGLPFISSNKGALSETVPSTAGVLINGDPQGEQYQREFVDEIIRFTDGDHKAEWHALSTGGKANAKDLGWDKIADKWYDMFIDVIAKKNDSPMRLIRQFTKHSDIIAAQRVCDDLENSLTPLTRKLEREKLDTRWGYRHSDDELKKHYLAMGKVTDERLSKANNEGAFSSEYFDESNEKRFHFIKECLQAERRNPVYRTMPFQILNYGCGHGWFDMYIERRLDCSIHGVDIDPGALKWSRHFRDKYAKNPDKLWYSPMIPKETFSCAVVSDVLEHCVDPVATIEHVEASVHLGGMVCITVPYGPREYSDYDRVEHLNHLHELDFRTLKEMFGKKPGVEIVGIPESVCEELNEPVGFYMVRYKADHNPVGAIDYERKLKIQAPKQTVSASIICGGNAEDTLGWCLRSLKHIADEIIIANCGMNKHQASIAHRFGAKVIEGVDPKVDGFDEARNKTLEHCGSDWILWIDTDEKLLDGNKLHKYLRENTYHGYSIHQHHFAVDNLFKPDVPVRLFRNRPYRNDSLKWYGSIHEHPETALNAGPGPSIIIGDAHIAHVGYLVESGRRERFVRNYPLLVKGNEKFPDRKLNKHFTMRDNMLLCDYELGQNGGVVTHDIVARCEQTIAIFREHFLGIGGYMGVDALEYYSRACRLLNIGVELAFGISAGKNSVNPPDVKTYRFATTEDFQKEMAWRTKDIMEPFISEYY